MPTINGELKDIVGASMASRVGRVGFRLNAPNIGVASAMESRLYPTMTEMVTPAADGKFSIFLSTTTLMAFEAWYILTIQWNDSAGTVTDFPDWQIRVPAEGGSLSSMISAGPGGPVANLSLVLLSLSKPKNLKAGQLWYQTDPDNPTNPANTGKIWIGE